MKIVKFKKYGDITVEFQDEQRLQVETTYQYFKRGTIKNPYDPYILGRGYYGVGKYKARNGKKTTKEHHLWFALLTRCYNEKQRYQYKSYPDCRVCDEWLNFQTFAQWVNENYYEIPNERVELDKDILVKGNKIYSPETCIFVPKSINLLFVNRRNFRGECPLGVNKTNNGKYTALYGHDKRTTYLGSYPTKEEAFYAFKTHKEAHIKKVADRYKHLIPNKLYNALYNYEFLITD